MGNLISLNPCFNGRYSQRALNSEHTRQLLCLNPCFNGRYSQREVKDQNGSVAFSLNPCFNGRYSQSLLRLRIRLPEIVLILVLMEDTLRVVTKVGIGVALCLNPCFNGRYSQRAKTYVPLYTSIWGMFKLLETLLLT